MIVLKEKKAQTALELAIFGAILIFVMGTIVRTTAGRSLQQHAILKATRMAMTLSHLSTETKQVSGRNAATVFIVEDRLTAASSKYGAIDRSPMMIQGSGTHSANLLMPIDFGDSEDLPVFDLYVNGKRFPFSTSAFKEVQIAQSCVEANPCPAECNDYCEANSPYYFPGRDIDPATQWEDECFEREVLCAEANPDLPCPDECDSCEGVNVADTYMVNVGCAKFFTLMDNHPLIPQWCDGDADSKPCRPPDWPIPCSEAKSPGCNLSANERFDLDRDGTSDVLVSERPFFSWQWFMVMGVKNSGEDGNMMRYSFSNLEEDPLEVEMPPSWRGNLMLGEGIIFPGGDEEPLNTSFDVDNDLKHEHIVANVDGGVQPNKIGGGGIITNLGIQDPHEGDIDFSYNSSDEAAGLLPFGFSSDVNLYTLVKGDGAGGGTYLQIDEGKLYSHLGGEDGDKQYIRTASKKDSVDIIQRAYRLSNNTGRYCGAYDADCQIQIGPTNWGEINYYCDSAGVDGVVIQRDITAGENIEGRELDNPVEVCGHTPGVCFSPENMNRICMDVENKIIFIRSRIQDVHGRKWVTDESQDPYVEFNVDN